MKLRVYIMLAMMLLNIALLSGCAVKPDPITEEEHWLKAIEDKERLYADQPPVSRPITMSMAIARALTYNYDHRLAMLEGAFQHEELAAANLAMLPKLTASAGYTARNNESASRSVSYFTHQQTLEPSISQERHRALADLSFNWSMLDFGISYFQAKQSADRYLIMEESKRRVSNNIVKDVVIVFWQAALAEKMLPKIQAAQADADKALANYREAREHGLEPILQTLEDEKRLMHLSNSLKVVSAHLAQSRIQLAALINIPMDQPFEIVLPDEEFYRNPPTLPEDVEALENIGLYLRPDLREDAYQFRIDKNEINKEIVRMLPIPTLTAGTNYDSNTYLYNNTWSEATARVSSNLLGLPAAYKQYKAAQTQAESTEIKHLANMVAALVQIRLAHHQYSVAIEDYNDSLKLSELEKEIYNVANRESEIGAISGLEKVERHTDLIAAELQEFNSISAICEAWGNLYFSIGGNVAADIPQEMELDEKAEIIRLRLDEWWAGNLPEPPQLSQNATAESQQEEDSFAAENTESKPDSAE